MRIVATVFVVFVTCTACVRFHEAYHFVGIDPASNEARNHYRVEVNGTALCSKARYIAGSYDERALDLFFNEIKTGSATDNVPRLFEGNVTLPGSTEQVAPLSGNAGRFLMIFSTNAKSVADTIGQFAENQFAADAITNLINRNEIRRIRTDSAQAVGRTDLRAQAVDSELTALIAALPSDPGAGNEESIEGALRVLNAIGAELGATESFDTLERARDWFSGRARRGGQS